MQAEVAELADAPGSGPGGGNTVGVRLPTSAPSFYERGVEESEVRNCDEQEQFQRPDKEHRDP